MNDFDLTAALERGKSENSGARLSIHSYRSMEPDYFARIKAAIAEAPNYLMKTVLFLHVSFTSSGWRPTLFGMKRLHSRGGQPRALAWWNGWMPHLKE